MVWLRNKKNVPRPDRSDIVWPGTVPVPVMVVSLKSCLWQWRIGHRPLVLCCHFYFAPLVLQTCCSHFFSRSFFQAFSLVVAFSYVALQCPPWQYCCQTVQKSGEGMKVEDRFFKRLLKTFMFG